jgi:hypothetical protein
VSFIASIACASALQAATITVDAGGNLQSALDAARPGDTIVLQAGAVFTGDFTLPAKGGAAYITIRSSAPDGSLPPAGSRITPSSAPLLAKIRSTSAGPAFRTAAGASYWRFLFLEIFPSTSTSSSNLVEFGTFSQTTLASVPHHLVMDRCYLHGDPGFGQRAASPSTAPTLRSRTPTSPTSRPSARIRRPSAARTVPVRLSSTTTTSKPRARTSCSAAPIRGFRTSSRPTS